MTWGEQIASDKNDYNMLRQSNWSRYAEENVDTANTLRAEFYSRLVYRQDTISADGYSFEHPQTVRVDYLNNADFAVSSQTTDDRHK